MPKRFSQEISDLQTLPMTRRIRRRILGVSFFTILVFSLTPVIDLFPWWDTTRFYGLASFISTSMAVGFSVFYVWLLRRANSATSLDERAQLDFAKPYARLSVMHKFDVRVRVGRELRKGGKPPDERDTAIQREAERRAFRVLRIAMPLFVGVFWGVCLCAPLGPVRVGLLIGAVVMSAMLIPVMILPNVIRLWTEPDAAPEANVVIIERET